MRRPTKKQLTQQVDSLLKLTDSLQQALMEYELPVADSLLLENEINEGDFNNPETDLDFNYDSLSTEQRLSLYYHQNQLNQMPDSLTLETLDTALLTSAIPDSVYINRLTRMNSFIKLPYNNIVRNHIIHYLSLIHISEPTRPY